MRNVLFIGILGLTLVGCDPTGNRASLSDIGSPAGGMSAAIPTTSQPIGLAVSSPDGNVPAFHTRIETCSRKNARANAAIQRRIDREAALQSSTGPIRLEVRGADVDRANATFQRCIEAAGYRVQ